MVLLNPHSSWTPPTLPANRTLHRPVHDPQRMILLNRREQQLRLRKHMFLLKVQLKIGSDMNL